MPRLGWIWGEVKFDVRFALRLGLVSLRIVYQGPGSNGPYFVRADIRTNIRKDIHMDITDIRMDFMDICMYITDNCMDIHVAIDILVELSVPSRISVARCPWYLGCPCRTIRISMDILIDIHGKP